MEKTRVLACAAVALFALTACSDQPGSHALNAAEHPPGPAEHSVELAQLITKPVKRDQVFFANHDFSEKQADYLRIHLDGLPASDRDCVEDNLRASFDERMAACEASGQWTFLCQGCQRISDSILYDPAAIITGMKMCGVDFELPEWH